MCCHSVTVIGNTWPTGNSRAEHGVLCQAEGAGRRPGGGANGMAGKGRKMAAISKAGDQQKKSPLLGNIIYSQKDGVI